MSDSTGGDFRATLKEFVDEQCAELPVQSTMLGLTEWDHDATDMSAAGIRRRHERQQYWRDRFAAMDETTLEPDEAVDRQLIISRLAGALSKATFEGWRRNGEEYVKDGLFFLFVHKAREESEAVAAAISRLRKVGDTVAAAKTNLDPALAHPDILRRDMAMARGQAHFVRNDLATFVSDSALRQEVQSEAQPAANAYDDLAAHLEQLIPSATGSFVYGEERYDAWLKDAEMLPYSTRELHQLGWDQYNELDAKMREVAQRLSGSDDWMAQRKRQQADHAADMPGLLAAYRTATEQARAFVRDNGVMSLPEGERCNVEPAPEFWRASVAVASYYFPAVFLRDTAGTFNVPFTPTGASAAEVEDRLGDNSNSMIPSIAVHEAYPGHHLHFARMGNAPILRHLLTSNYFIEGWALYAERIMAEAGYFTTDAELLEHYAMRLMRAARIIVDTQLHMGEISIDEAAAFMHEKVGLTPSVAKTEAMRYAAWPTQAAGYLTGSIEIERVRDQWLAQGLGSLRQFNDSLTDSGAMPVALAARAIGVEMGATATS